MFMLTACMAPRALAAPGDPNKYTFSAGIMGTSFSIICQAPDRDTAARAATASFAEARRINEVASDYIADSELLRLSRHASGEKITISPLLFKLVSEALQFADRTVGAYDPTVGPLTVLWRESRRRKTLPESPTLSKALAATGWKNCQLDPAASTLTFLKTGMRLDLGGIAKGQAADAMLEAMKANGVPRCCITAGGDIRAGDPPQDEEGWKVGVRVRKEDGPEAFKHLVNEAVSTSGDLHQFIEIGGIRYSHIIDPTTGLGLTRNAAVTILAKNSTTSDALATACCVAAPEVAKSMGLAAGASEVHLW